MSADLVSDPAIFATYHELHNPDSALDWLFLGYSAAGSKDRLELAASGDSGLEGLKAALSQSNALNIHFGLLRLEGRFLLFTLLPDNTGGVKRARALVHSRAVGTKLQHQATLTVARPSDLTINAVRSKLKLDTGSAASSLPSSPNPLHSAGTFAPSPYLQPSPLRSHFPASQVDPVPNDGISPPPPPDKDNQAILRMRSNNSLKTAQLATPPFSPPIRQSSREGTAPSSPSHAPSLPPNDAEVTERMRQLSTASTSSTHSASLGLGFGNSISSLQSHPTSRAAVPHSSSAYSDISISPRLNTLEVERNQRMNGSQRGPSSPILAHISVSKARLTPRSLSPTGSTSSAMSAGHAQGAQDLPLPLSASPSVPTSARSLEASTLDRMFRPSESIESLDHVVVESRETKSPSGPTEDERIAVAEAIARAAEASWQAKQQATSTEDTELSSRTGPLAELQSYSPVNDAHSYNQQILSQQPLEQVTVSREAHQDYESFQREALRLQAEAELARLEEEAQRRARAHERAEEQNREAARQHQEAEAKAERQKEEEAAEGERKRLSEEAEREQRRATEAEVERQRQEAEAETEAIRHREEAEAEVRRQRKQAEDEAERQRKEAEDNALRQRQEAEAAAEAERLRSEEARFAEERARQEAILTLQREKEQARQRAHQDLQGRIKSLSDEVALTGYLSVQGGSSILWRRRYFQLTSRSIRLYKNDREVDTPVDEVLIANNVKKIEEDSEDLIAISHSFKLIFNDYDEEPYLFYCDEEDDKDLLLVGLRAAASLE